MKIVLCADLCACFFLCVILRCSCVFVCRLSSASESAGCNRHRLQQQQLTAAAAPAVWRSQQSQTDGQTAECCCFCCDSSSGCLSLPTHPLSVDAFLLCVYIGGQQGRAGGSETLCVMCTVSWPYERETDQTCLAQCKERFSFCTWIGCEL